jgi:hypothetical protein
MTVFILLMIMCCFSWWFILKFNILEGQAVEGFFFGGVYDSIWNNNNLTEFGKIIISFVFFIFVAYIMLSSLLILKRLFIKQTKQD